jgi:exopolysaccharide production protein ExoQ
MGLHLPPIVALFLTVAFIVFLFRRDFREQPNITRALWLPVLWMVISCSRPVTQWLNICGLPVSGAVSLEDGSPLDACFYFALIATGIYVLNKRGFNLGKFIENNGWLVAFLFYCLLAIVWSDFPFVAFKRWIKILGLPVMALILFTEPDFEEAVRRLLKRCAYVVVPLSIMLIKYYPEIGRAFDKWTGLATNNGVAQTKNMLACMLMLLGLFFFWHFLQVLRAERGPMRRKELLLIAGFGFMILWLFRMVHSATSLTCLMVGMLVMVLLGLRSVNKRYIGIYLLLTVVALTVAELLFGVSAYVIKFLQRDPTLTDRTTLWADLLKMKTNPIFGVGFESFWLGDRLVQTHEGRAFQPNEAHNGYLETYLSLGLVGLFMLVGVLIATFRKIRLGLLKNFEWGRFQVGFFIALLLYNCTEVSFRGPNTLWLVFYITAIQYPKAKQISAAPLSEGWELEEESELAHVP